MTNSKTKKQPTAKANNTRRQFWQCARKLQDWGPQFTIAKEHMFTNKDFNPKSFNEALAQGASPKLVKLLETIRQLDAADMAEHKTLFKHYIYSDVDEANYGARMVISALVAAGFTNMIPDMRSILPPQPASETNPKLTFAFLSSKEVVLRGQSFTFDSPVQAYDAQGRALRIDDKKNVGLTGPNPYRPSMKKYVTETYNAPTNSHGDHIRFIVLDKKFKEGLDLFDVKYAHLMESMSPSETTQAEGRGTRNCGQKNLAFKTNEGWSLHVYHYLARLPKHYAAGYGWGDTDKFEDVIKKHSDADETTEYLTENFTNSSIKSAVDRALSVSLEMQYQRGGYSSALALAEPAKYSSALALREPAPYSSALAIREPAPYSSALAIREPAPYSSALALREPTPSALALREPTPSALALREPTPSALALREPTPSALALREPEPSALALRASSPVKHINPFQVVPRRDEPPFVTKYTSPERPAIESAPVCEAAETLLPSKSDFCRLSSIDQLQTYGRLSRKVHPDKNPGCPTLATTRFHELSELRNCNQASPLKLRATRSTWDDVKDTAGLLASNAWQGTKNKTYHAWEGTKNKTYNAWQSTKNKTYNAWQSTKGELYDAWKRATKKASPKKSPLKLEASPEPVQAEQLTLEDQMYQKLKPVTDAQLASLNINNPPLTEFQKNIARTFGHADLPKLPVESDCSRPKPPEGQVAAKKQAAKLNMTQDLLRRYVTPVARDTPVMVTKGMLLWHSTGAGKTCTAVAIASNFEEAGYLVVYVCPGSLTSEIKKNVWDSTNICHGKNLKENWGHLQDIKESYDSCWLGGPMSYKTFTNLIKGLGGGSGGSQALKDRLRSFDAKHGIPAKQRQADPFHKMLIIIDEAQKLYSNELGPLEQPHMPTVETYLHKSYAMNEADPTYPCARVVLMTATPISKSPFELFQLLNLVRPKSDALPITMAEFKGSSLVDETGSPKNAAIMEKLQGYISYLDLSKNRARFAQKVHHIVEVPMSGTTEPATPPFDRKAVEAEKKALMASKLAACTGKKAACNKQVKEDPEVAALDAQLKNRPKTAKKKYDKTKDFTQLGALQECATRYLGATPKLDFYPSDTDQGPRAGYKFIQNGPKGSGYYNVSGPETAEKVALQVVDSVEDVQKEIERVTGQAADVATNFVAATSHYHLKFTGWTFLAKGPKGSGFYVNNNENKLFIPADEPREEGIAGWIFRRGKEGLGYYATAIKDTIKEAIKARVGNYIGYTPRKHGGRVTGRRGRRPIRARSFRLRRA